MKSICLLILLLTLSSFDKKYSGEMSFKIKEKILEIYYDDFEYYPKENHFKPLQFDFILKNRKEIFDYRILAD